MEVIDYGSKEKERRNCGNHSVQCDRSGCPYTDLYKQQLISLTEFEKMMGKKKFAELLGEYVAKPPGKLALVPESDPRPPVDLSNGVTEEFEVLENE